MKLHDMSPDDILAEIEKRSDNLALQDRTAGDYKTSLQALEAASAIAYRDSGMSMAEAERRVRTTPEWREAYTRTQHQQVEASRARRDYDRAIVAADLWRSENATRRQIG